MKSKTQLPWTVLVPVLLGLAAVLLSPSASSAGDASWWGSSAWWDWSDFRATIAGRVFLARLASATLTRGGVDFDLKGSHYGFTDEPEPFRELLGELYIDRLGFRFNVEENTYRGRSLTDPTAGVTSLEFSSSRLGLDLDLIRYPFFRFGIDCDFNVDELKFIDGIPNAPAGNYPAQYNGAPPVTLGIHGRVIPCHIREVPFTIQSRFRFPMPFLNRQGETRITDWEISGGLRPAIWDTSLYGHSTFSFDIEAGYRSVNFDANPQVTTGPPFPPGPPLPPSDISLKMRWQGAFFQVGMFF